MSEQATQFANREQYEREITHRELRLEEIGADISELEEQLEDARAAAIVGEGAVERVTELKSKISEAIKQGTDIRAEVEALRKRMARFSSEVTAAQRQTIVEKRIAPALGVLVEAAHQVDQTATELGEALAAMLSASTEAGNHWPIPNPNILTRFINIDDLLCHTWLRVRQSAGDRIGNVPAVPASSNAVLQQTGKDVFGGPVSHDQPMVARRFAANWIGALHDEAGRPDLAHALKKKIESGPQSESKSRKAKAVA